MSDASARSNLLQSAVAEVSSSGCVTLSMGIVLVVLSASACECEDKSQTVLLQPPPPPRAPVVAPRAIAAGRAFDMVMSAHGPLLVWALPRKLGGGLRAIRLSEEGSALGHELVLGEGGVASTRAADQAPLEVHEVVAHAEGASVVVAWVAQTGLAAVVEATMSVDNGATFARPNRLGEADVQPQSSRGVLAVLASREGRTGFVGYRAYSPTCVEPDSNCAVVRHTELTKGGAGETFERRIAQPCANLLRRAANASDGSVWIMCRKASMMSSYVGPPFTPGARPEPGSRHDSPIGCSPLGAMSYRGKVLAATSCADGVLAFVLDGKGAVRPVTRGAHPALGCTANGIDLGLQVGKRFEVALRLKKGAVQSDLEMLLPPDVAPPNSRAAWSGSALLVAVPVARELTLRRYECIAAKLVRTDPIP